MKTTPLIALTLTISVCSPSSTAAAGHHDPASATKLPVPQQQTRTLGDLPEVAPSYGWPLRPFDRQHPVRGFLNDPRIGKHGSRAFHFGIDVAAPDGTPVYAVTGGKLYLAHGSLSVVSGPHHEFGYWHIVRDSSLREHQIVHRHQLLGTIAPGWGHVHFAERIGDEYVNPLRPGGLGPYTDPTVPTVEDVTVSRNADDTILLLAHAHDTTWPRVPGPWAYEPVTPALLRFRVTKVGEASAPWRTAADFREHMLDRTEFGSVYSTATTQNHEGRPGTYGFILSSAWRPAAGAYRVDVAASDTRGNTAVGSVVVRVG
jgi:peptidase M23-like protein